MAAESGVRIGDAERERAATNIREHYASGRLSLEEFQQRLDAVFAAKTDMDLAKITRDLPHSDPYAAPWPPSSQPYRPPTPSYPVGAGQGSRSRRPGSGPMSFLWACMALCVLGIVLFASFSWLPFGLPRMLVILLAILTFCRRIFRRIGGRRR